MSREVPKILQLTCVVSPMDPPSATPWPWLALTEPSLLLLPLLMLDLRDFFPSFSGTGVIVAG